MKLKQTLGRTVAGMAIALGLFVFGGNMALAISCGTNSDGTPITTSIIDCSDVPNTGDPVEDNGAWKLLVTIIQIMTAGVGIAGVGGIVFGGVRYATSAGNFERAKKSLIVIANVGIGLVAYALMFALLNFIIPGGLFT
jgi:hypothetical protein